MYLHAEALHIVWQGNRYTSRHHLRAAHILLTFHLSRNWTLPMSICLGYSRLPILVPLPGFLAGFRSINLEHAFTEVRDVLSLFSR